MSDFAVVLAPGAEVDIADAFLWYYERNTLVADGFRDEVFDAIDRIGEAPLSSAPDEEGNRRFVLRRFPFSVVYEVQERTVTVLAWISTAWNSPKNWRRRMGTDHDF